jgi:hypothetical protein
MCRTPRTVRLGQRASLGQQEVKICHTYKKWQVKQMEIRVMVLVRSHSQDDYAALLDFAHPTGTPGYYSIQ